jgi:hypothetical protein
MTTELPRTGGALRWALRSYLGLSFAALLFGCAAGTPRIATDIEAEVPANLHADYVAFVDNCSKCHDLERPLRAHIDDVRHWDLYVAKMMRTAGSAISARESPKILRFLYWYTERKKRLETERAKEVLAPVTEAPAPAEVPPPPAAPQPAPEAAPAPQPETNAVNPAPAPVKQGEGAP